MDTKELIKLLVENNKIDLEKLREKSDLYCLLEREWDLLTPNNILMVLSIQDNPAEFLISILK